MTIGNYRIKTLFDTGASRTVMGTVGLQLATACGREVVSSRGRKAKVPGELTVPIAGYARLPFEVEGVTRDIWVAIVPDEPVDGYVGADFIREFSAVLDPDSNRLTMKAIGKEVALEVAGFSTTETMEFASVGLETLTQSEEAELMVLVNEVLGAEDPPLGCTTWITHKIDVGDARPIKQRYYPVSKKIEEEMHAQVRDLLNKGIVVPSESGWSNPIVMVKKGADAFRMCIDFRKVNQLTKPDAYPLPYMDAILRKLRSARYISTLDLSSAYH